MIELTESAQKVIKQAIGPDPEPVRIFASPG